MRYKRKSKKENDTGSFEFDENRHQKRVEKKIKLLSDYLPGKMIIVEIIEEI